MKKILYLVTLSEMGGAQKYVLDLASGLEKSRFETAVAAGGNGSLFGLLEKKGIRSFHMKNLKRPICPMCDLRAYLEIRKLIKTWKPDILHLNSSKAGILGSLAAKGLPVKVVYTVHGSVFEASFSSLSKKLFLLAEKMTAGFKQKIICVSERDHRLWLENRIVPAEKLAMIHNGIDLNIDFLTKERARHQFIDNCQCQEPFVCGALRPTQYVIGTIANFYPEKSLETLIDAANLLIKNPRKKDDPVFVLIGSGPLEKKLKSKIARMELGTNFIFTGPLPEAAKYLKGFDVFVLPSEKEGLPYTIIEAMAAGLPIVATRVGGIPKMVQDGMNGYLIAPHDSEALAERITQLIENPTQAQFFAENSLKKAQAFSLQKMLRETEKLYN